MKKTAIKETFPKKALITVAGTVGIGKSTFAKGLADCLGYQTSMEKVEGNPYLDKFYKDFKRWAFHLQIYFLAERFKEHKRIFNAPFGVVQDRSIYEDTGIFARMHYEKGNMTKMDFDTYENLFEAMVMTPYFNAPDVLVYLEGSFEQILNRIKARGREMEKQTPIAYWQEMFERYDAWINTFDQCPVIRVNIDQYDLHHDPNSLYPIIEKIASTINK
ncbi:deoxyadenosine/deoxycytidine kinase [Pullulanibacillus pueri]|uniref:Deoxycytidine kinase n=1 Tax=Pullulanibacillus pueri TaxID=1437324 RepID=A0A8J2ZV45_9BACL|nr:deoxynucleoside kinase [Pullulanibacillus pueri]MBM7682150.1 deoxyadenosine/deoxycytidine kinase [Pullulanibacillus pueri]GGH80226.1 deoxycytidine kinase [Pullulanibacillus pueri]